MFLSPCNCSISSAMMKNNQMRVRSFDTNWRGLLNSTAAVLGVRGRSLREKEEEDVDTGSVQCPCTTVPVLQPHSLLKAAEGAPLPFPTHLPPLGSCSSRKMSVLLE